MRANEILRLASEAKSEAKFTVPGSLDVDIITIDEITPMNKLPQGVKKHLKLKKEEVAFVVDDSEIIDFPRPIGRVPGEGANFLLGKLEGVPAVMVILKGNKGQGTGYLFNPKDVE